MNTTMEKVVYSVPFAKVDKEKRIVSGFATLDNLDKQKDIVTTEASVKAFKSFRGNVRELHDKIAAGRLLSFGVEKYFDAVANKVYDGIFVRAYISKGAPNTWEKVLDGTLSGFSIGGDILESEDIVSEDGTMVRVIKDYELYELSLVDNPANPFANVTAIEKAVAHFNDIADTIDKEKELKDMTTGVEKSVDTIEAPEVVAEEVVADVVAEEPVVETVAEVVEESPVVVDAPAEVVDAVEEAAETVEVPSDAVVITDALNEIKALLAAKGTETDQAFAEIVSQLKELRSGVESTGTELAAVKSTVNEFGKRVDSVEADTAVRKSGDLGEVVQVKETHTEKSLWGGRFLSAADL